MPLPPVDDCCVIRGVSFSSAPRCADFVVLAVEALRGFLVVRTWLPDEQEWTKAEFGNHDDDGLVSFVVPFQNPVFHDGEFYLLARHGKLGVFNPTDMMWRVLDK